MGHSWVVTAALLTGCGRIGFDPVGELAGGDGGGGDGAFQLCPPNAFICDDFESGNLTKWNYIDVSGTAMSMPTATRVLHGALSLESEMLAGTFDGEAGPVYRFGTEQSTGSLAVRLWFNTPVPLVNFDLLASFRNPTGQYVNLGGDGGTWVSTDQDTSGGSRDHYSTVAAPALDMWMCAELVITFGAGPARIQAFLDHAPLLDVMTFDTAPAYTEVMIGVARAHMAGYRVFVDDVAVAPQRLGCF